jgi:hypothetical protein
MKRMQIIGDKTRNSMVFRLYTYYFIDSLALLRSKGLKELIRQRGVRFLVIIVAYYLVRDALVYIVVPFCIAQGIR